MAFSTVHGCPDCAHSPRRTLRRTLGHSACSTTTAVLYRISTEMPTETARHSRLVSENSAKYRTRPLWRASHRQYRRPGQSGRTSLPAIVNLPRRRRRRVTGNGRSAAAEARQRLDRVTAVALPAAPGSSTDLRWPVTGAGRQRPVRQSRCLVNNDGCSTSTRPTKAFRPAGTKPKGTTPRGARAKRTLVSGR